MTVLPFDQPALTGITPVEVQEDESHVVEIGIGLAAAYLAYRWWVKPRLAEHHPRTPEESRAAARSVVGEARHAWDAFARPAATAAYLAAGGDKVPYPVVDRLAQAFASELGDYVDATSVDALVDGFTAQIANGWGEGISWMRASEGFGLDGRQMRSYLSGLMARDRVKYSGDPIPPGVAKKVEAAALARADLLGMNESRKAVQMGKNMVWLAMAAQGDLPPGTMKKWVTAHDERVCAVCGPLDQVTIPLHRQFESSGQRFHAPVVHPNCRCNLEIVYPPLDVVKKDVTGDPYDRNLRGEFAVREERTRPRLVVEQQERPRLATEERARPRLGEVARPRLQETERNRLVADERPRLRPIEDVVEEVEEIADEALAAEGKPLRSYDEPTLIPAFAFLSGSHPKWLMEFPGDLVGRHVTLDKLRGYTVAAQYQAKDANQSEAFYNSVDEDLPMAARETVARNREHKQASRLYEEDAGGIAVAAAIAPGTYAKDRGEEYQFVRESMGGLTKAQLINAAEAALRDHDARNPLLYVAPDAESERMSAEDILGWMKTIDASTIASEIFVAYHREQDQIDKGNLSSREASWSKVIEVIKDAAVNGDKSGVFDYGSIGRTSNLERAHVYLFRADRWLGDKPPNNMFLADTDLAEVSGMYRISRVSEESIPALVRNSLETHGQHDPDYYESCGSVIVMDIEPVKAGMTDEGR